MNIKFKILFTNWINISGILVITYLSGVVSELLKIKTIDDISGSLITGFLGGLFAIIFYGAIFWVGFLMIIFLLDFILINKNKETLKLKLFIEWILISTPFIYWLVKYNEWIFLVAIITFFVTQLLREKLILKII